MLDGLVRLGETYLGEVIAGDGEGVAAIDYTLCRRTVGWLDEWRGFVVERVGEPYCLGRHLICRRQAGEWRRYFQKCNLAGLVL